ncbi:hypothetical protein Plhal710r2_c031g0114681 [Plasmopara halstedii]
MEAHPKSSKIDHCAPRPPRAMDYLVKDSEEVDYVSIPPFSGWVKRCDDSPLKPCGHLVHFLTSRLSGEMVSLPIAPTRHRRSR